MHFLFFYTITIVNYKKDLEKLFQLLYNIEYKTETSKLHIYYIFTTHSIHFYFKHKLIKLNSKILKFIIFNFFCYKF